MSSLEQAAIQMIQSLYSSAPIQSQRSSEHTFIEVISFADGPTIAAMLDLVDKKYWLEFPVWARVLSYRLACLQLPNDPQIRRRASAGLLSFGPDWDEEAAKLIEEANNLTQ